MIDGQLGLMQDKKRQARALCDEGTHLHEDAI